MTQYNVYSTPSTAILNLFYSKLQIFDQYIIFETSDNVYSMLVKNIPTGNITRYDCTRNSSSGYNNQWSISSYSVDTFEYTVSNEYYVYSNVGLGTMQVLPVHSISLTFAVGGICAFLFLKQIFRRLFYDRKH